MGLSSELCWKGTPCDPGTCGWKSHRPQTSPDEPEVPTKHLSSSRTSNPSLAAKRASVYGLKNAQISILNSPSHRCSSPGGASSPGSLLRIPPSGCFMVIISLYSPEFPTAVGLCRMGGGCVRPLSICGPAWCLFAFSLLVQAQKPTSQHL